MRAGTKRDIARRNSGTWNEKFFHLVPVDVIGIHESKSEIRGKSIIYVCRGVDTNYVRTLHLFFTKMDAVDADDGECV